MSGRVPAGTERDMARIVQAVRELFCGRSNATGTVTLRASQTTTTVSAPNIAAASTIFLQAITANAAAIVAATYISSVAEGSFVITHTSNANTDKKFFWRIAS